MSDYFVLIPYIIMQGAIFAYFYYFFFRPKRAKKKLKKRFPVGSKVRILRAPFPEAHMVEGSVGVVVGYREYSTIPSRVSVKCNLTPQIPEQNAFYYDLDFRENQIEPVPALRLVTNAELRQNYQVD